MAEINYEMEPGNIADFIDDSLKDVPGASKQYAIEKMRAGLIVDPAKEDMGVIAKAWTRCAEASKLVSEADFEKQLGLFLRDVVCDATEYREAIATGIIRNWISDAPGRRDFSAQLARGLLGEDGKPCTATQNLSEKTKNLLRPFLSAAATDKRSSSPTTATHDPN